MSEIKSSKFAFTYVGCFIGAGFLSGQELWQFFGSFGGLGIVGLIIAVAIQVLLGYVIIRLAKRCNTSEFDMLIAPSKSTIIRGFFGFAEVLFTFFIVTVMTAGAGSLLYSVFSLPKWIGSTLFSLVIAVVALRGLNGVVKVFSFTVPILLTATALVSVLALSNYGYPSLLNVQLEKPSAFLPNFLIASILFSSYNVFCSLGVITPLAINIKNNSVALVGSVLSGIILLLVALAVLLPIFSASQFSKSDLPMLEIARSLNGYLFYFYSALTFMGIFGTALSSVVSIQNYSSLKFRRLKDKKHLTIISALIASGLLSLVGFSTLIGVLYPLSGIVGAVGGALIVKNYISKNDKR